MTQALNSELEPLIFTMRGRRVLLDADLARLYGVSTKALNQAVKRNADRFPLDFAFQLDQSEFDSLRSQIVTSKMQALESMVKSRSRSQPVIGPERRGGTRVPPWVSTEHGSLMAANVLRSDHAVRMSVFVVRAFVRLREQVAANTAVVALPLIQPPADPPKRRIGFHPEDQ